MTDISPEPTSSPPDRCRWISIRATPDRTTRAATQPSSPRAWWDDSYYTPVSTYNVSSQDGDERTTVWLYNPGASAITVTYQRRTAAGALTSNTLTVNANSTNKQILENGAAGVGSHFYTTPATVTAGTSTTVTNNQNATYTSRTFSHTTPAGANRLLLVGVAIANDATTQANVSGVTFGGTPLTFVGRVMAPTGGGGTPINSRPQTEIWALANPPASTTANVIVNLTGSRPFVAGATTYTGVDVSNGLASALGGYASNSANGGTTFSVDVDTAAGQAVYDVVASSRYGTATPANFTRGGGQTANWSNITVRQNTNRLKASSSWLIATGATTTMTWTGENYPWAISALAINPVSYPFYAYSTTDSASATGATYNQAWDWSYTMIPESMLTTQALVGLGIGRDPDSGTNPTENGNPVWVTPVGNGNTAASVYYDFDADPTTGSVTDASGYLCDGVLSLRELDQARIYDTTDRDQTGTLIYTLDPNVKLAVAWGQDPERASASAPGLDVGTSVPPMPEFTAGKDGLLYDDPNLPGMEGDLDNDGYISAGDIIEWPIDVRNVSRLPVPDIVVEDDIPTDTTYVADSTYLCWDPDEDGDYDTEVLLADDTAGTPFPLDEGGYNYGDVYGSLAVGGSFTIRFRVQIANPVTDGTIAILNDGSATAFDWTDPVGDRVFLRARLGDFVWWDENNDGIQDATEGGMPEVTVTLYDGQGHIVRNIDGTQMTSITDETGLYDFKGLLPGSYRVEFLLPPPTELSYAEISPRNATDDATDSDAYPSTDATNPCRTDMFTLGGADWNRTIDCGVMLIVDPGSTLAVVDSFAAYLADGEVVATWQTSSLVGTMGFYLERKEGDSWVRVSKRFVPALFESPEWRLVQRNRQRRVARPAAHLSTRRSGKVGTTAPPWSLRGSRRCRDARRRGREHACARQRHRPRSEDGYKPDPALVETVDLADQAGRRHQDEDRGDRNRALSYRCFRSGRHVAGYRRSCPRPHTLAGGQVDQSWRDCGLPAGVGQFLALLLRRGYRQHLHVGERVLVVARQGHGHEQRQRIDGPRSPRDRFRRQRSRGAESVQLHRRLPRLGERLLALGLSSSLVRPAPTFRPSLLTSPGAIQGLSLTVSLLGMTTIPQVDEHHVQVRLNGTLLGDDRWSGMDPRSATFTIPAGVLTPGTNQVSVTAVLDATVDHSVFAVDSVDLEYQRSATAVDDMLLPTAAAKAQMTVNGLDSTGAWVFELANPLTPQVVKIVQSGTDLTGAWVKFATKAATRYLVATPGGALRPIAITAVGSSQLTKAGLAGIDYVVVTHPALAQQAATLADYRAGQGMKTMVVTTDEIYDYFNYGIVDPHAIRAFVAYAMKRPSLAPDYVVFVGDGSFDYKDYQGYGDSLVPPLMVDTADGLAPSDNLLADITGNDGVPEVAIGRIPALTEAEVADALSKIQAYEAASSGSWAKSVLLAADNFDPDAGDFSADSDALAALVPAPLTVAKAYLDDADRDAVRAAILSGFAGTLWINYIGHSGIDNWAQENVLVGADAPGLGASARLPFVTALTCVAGQFALPGSDCLSEALVKQAGAGAIAVFSPTAREENGQSVQLGSLFVRNMFASTRGTVLGKAVRASLQAGAAAGLPTSLLATYNLLGDPAVRMKW